MHARLAAVLVALSLGLLGCGGGDDSDGSDGAATTATPPVASAPPTPTAAPTQGVRLGCSEYCQQAGGFGTGEESGSPMMTVQTSGTVAPLPDGTVPIELSCQFTAQCAGRLILDWDEALGELEGDAGRSDILVDAGASQTLLVALSEPGRNLLVDRGELPVDVVTDLYPVWQGLPDSERPNWNSFGLQKVVISMSAGSGSATP
jgi:hypothetical protein